MSNKKKTESVEATATKNTEGVNRGSGRARSKRKTTYERIKETDIPVEVIKEFHDNGWHLRFIRFMIDGRPDYRYLARREKEGFELVSLNEIPDWYKDAFSLEDDRHRKGMLVSGDVVLMKLPLEVLESRRQYFANETDAIVKAVDVNVLKGKGFLDLGSKSQVNYKEPSFQS